MLFLEKFRKKNIYYDKTAKEIRVYRIAIFCDFGEKKIILRRWVGRRRFQKSGYFYEKIFIFIINFGHRSQETHVYMESKARKAAFEVGIVECIPVPMPTFCFS